MRYVILAAFVLQQHREQRPPISHCPNVGRISFLLSLPRAHERMCGVLEHKKAHEVRVSGSQAFACVLQSGCSSLLGIWCPLQFKGLVHWMLCNLLQLSYECSRLCGCSLRPRNNMCVCHREGGQRTALLINYADICKLFLIRI